ncbi:Low-density lipoprotein receptor-related protein 8 [Papilio xuthus]|uniref:Low-density lipoprotein receptor-related protein 8 n=1 Tax=Papilio xuthus TaxID=66420 RepID=A0A194QDE3_PAPXU|nr:Low-density lipoprotein receptor-related protein 8 [Papilio xuthus]
MCVGPVLHYIQIYMMDQIEESGEIRGVGVDWVSGRVYWTAVEAGRGGQGGEQWGALRVAAADGRRRVTLWRRRGAEPDDLVIASEQGWVIWSERGAEPALLAAGLDGAGARELVARRVRRPAALALLPPARRLYFVDGYHDALRSVALLGGDLATHVVFAHRPHDAPQLPKNLTDEAYVSQWTRTCARMAVWEETLWCATARGLARLPRRARTAPAPPPQLPRARRPVTAVAVLHAVLFPPGE